MLRGARANVRGPWKLKSGKKSLPRFKKTNVHGARAVDHGKMTTAAGAFSAANRRGQFDYTRIAGPDPAELHAARGSRANCCDFWDCSGWHGSRTAGPRTNQAARGRQAGACLTGK
tara:strand:+ start:360 stop:707 length:348 start_codon:yes stop_codon:yes gene_type:complete